MVYYLIRVASDARRLGIILLLLLPSNDAELREFLPDYILSKL
jgi:hypothetical protein